MKNYLHTVLINICKKKNQKKQTNKKQKKKNGWDKIN